MFRSTAKVPTKVVDTVGAGDTFTAAFIASMICGKSPQEALEIGTIIAGDKVGHRGFKIPTNLQKILP